MQGTRKDARGIQPLLWPPKHAHNFRKFSDFSNISGAESHFIKIPEGRGTYYHAFIVMISYARVGLNPAGIVPILDP